MNSTHIKNFKKQNEMLSVKQIQNIKELGVDVDNLTPDDIIDELIKRAYLLALSAEWSDKEFLRREIVRVLKPNS